MDNISDISDETLRYELETRGQTIGPIVDSTRELYKRLLKRLIEEEMSAEEEEEELNPIDGQTSGCTHMSDKQKSSEMQFKPKSKSKYLLFLLSLILCIIFAYFVKKG